MENARTIIIKMCLTETCSRVRVGKNLSDMIPIRNGLKQGDALSPLLFNFALEFAIRRVQVNQDSLKLSGTHQLLVYADDVNILGGSVHTVKKNAEALIVASKEVGLEVPYFPAHKTHFFPRKFDLNSTCVLCAKGKYYFQTYKYLYIYYTTSLS